MSLSENLYNLGALMKTNLEEKGIDGLTGNEGLTTLANKILDIEPSVAGLELSTSIDCNVSSNEVAVGQSVVFSATLSASYDDTSIEDIDISGVLTGATVLFKTSDGTIIGSGVTDVNGVATYTHTIEEIGNITVYSEFEGSTNFSSCISSTTVTVECNYDFDVTVDKEILSANDNDIATFNCRLSDGTGGVSGESIDYQILYNDTVLSSGSKDTNANGEITLEYAATGVGNVDVIFSYGTLLQKTYTISDMIYYSSIERNLSSVNKMTRITSSLSISLPSNCEVSFDLKSTSSSCLMTLEPLSFVRTSQDHWLAGWMENSRNAYLIGYSTTSTTEVARITKDSNYHNFKFVIDNDSVKFYIDDIEKGTASISWLSDYSDFTFAYSTWNYSIPPTVKNLSIKALNPISLTSTSNIISYNDNESTTITATVNHPFNNNQAITFTAIDKNENIIDTYTTTTDNNGIATYEYESRGIGDVTIEAKCMSLQETFVIQDLYLYDTLTSDNGLFSVRTGSASLQYSSNGLSYLGTRTTDTYTYLNSQLPTNYEIECTITGLTYDVSYGQFCVDIWLNNTGITCSTLPNWIGLTWGSIMEGNSYSDKDTSKRLQIGDVIRFKRENGSISIYLNGTLMGTYTETNTDGFCLKTYDTRGITIKDLKIKAL